MEHSLGLSGGRDCEAPSSAAALSPSLHGDRYASTSPWEEHARSARGDSCEYPYFHEEAADVGDHGSDGGLGIMEAFANFNLRAEKRVQELLAATDAKLFCTLGDEDAIVSDPSQPPTPSYVLMSDQYRATKPPEFHHWRHCFPYLQVVGKSSFDEAPDEHIQIRPAPQPSAVSQKSPVQDHFTSKATADQAPCEAMAAVGRAIHLQVDPSDPPQEELILADGEMEEVLEDGENLQDDGGDDRQDAVANSNGGGHEDRTSSRGSRASCCGVRPITNGSRGCPSPRTSQVEEQVDAITLKCFPSLVPPLVTKVFSHLLLKQQQALRVTRENHELAVHLAHEAQIAAEEEQMRREQHAAHERALHEAAVAKIVEQGRLQEQTRREEIRRQQREENDEEEIKIRTLSYSHTREWYQPEKKCFAHRGRQFTYLKPVRKGQEEREAETEMAGTDVDSGNHTNEERRATERIGVGRVPTKPVPAPATSSLYGRRSIRRISSPSPSDLAHAKSSPATSPSTNRARTSTSSPSSSSSIDGRPMVRLPMLAKGKHKTPPTIQNATTEARAAQNQTPPYSDTIDRFPPPPSTLSQASLHANNKIVSATVAAPSRVYKISPYRIPPAILAKPNKPLLDDQVNVKKPTKQTTPSTSIAVNITAKAPIARDAHTALKR